MLPWPHGVTSMKHMTYRFCYLFRIKLHYCGPSFLECTTCSPILCILGLFPPFHYFKFDCEIRLWNTCTCSRLYYFLSIVTTSCWDDICDEQKGREIMHLNRLTAYINMDLVHFWFHWFVKIVDLSVVRYYEWLMVHQWWTLNLTCTKPYNCAIVWVDIFYRLKSHYRFNFGSRQ